MQTLLEVKDIRKYFPVTSGSTLAKTVGWIKAVDGCSFFIEGGQTFGLVGESGCGKTTISKLILLLEKPTAGSIFFRSKEISKLRGQELYQFRASVQAVFQDPFSSLDPRMRVGTIVAEPLVVNNALPKKIVRENVERVLAQVGLNQETVHRFPHEFSGGQRQRIALARSLIVHPRLIILDEPVSALDVSVQAQIMNLLKDLQAELNVGYLLIAHNLATVTYMSQWIGVMYLGKIVEQGSVDRVYGARLHPYTKALFSATLPSHPDKAGEEIVLTGEVPSALNPPAGCHFHPRCQFAMEICHKAEPELKNEVQGHKVACHLY